MGSSLTHAKSLGKSGSLMPSGAKDSDLSYTLGAARRSERRNLRKFVHMCEHMLLNCFREVSGQAQQSLLCTWCCQATLCLCQAGFPAAPWLRHPGAYSCRSGSRIAGCLEFEAAPPMFMA